MDRIGNPEILDEIMTKIAIQIGDVWTKNGEVRAVKNITRNGHDVRVWYRTGDALINCRRENFRKWCAKATKK